MSVTGISSFSAQWLQCGFCFIEKFTYDIQSGDKSSNTGLKVYNETHHNGGDVCAPTICEIGPKIDCLPCSLIVTAYPLRQ